MCMYNYPIEMVNYIPGTYMSRTTEFTFRYLLASFCPKDFGQMVPHMLL